MLKTVSIKVIGKVQGVFFRQSTKEKAIALGIGGTVRNQPDGSVYILATGTNEQLKELSDWCTQGPPRASVSSIEINEQPLESFSGFSIQKF